eukprot:COSAG05_NODE_23036_length_260_cov_1.869565_1_plen_27_part_10
MNNVSMTVVDYLKFAPPHSDGSSPERS